jgi:hypothetical protein
MDFGSPDARHGRFPHSTLADDSEMSGIEVKQHRKVAPIGHLTASNEQASAIFPGKVVCPRRDLNPCYRRERPVS